MEHLPDVVWPQVERLVQKLVVQSVKLLQQVGHWELLMVDCKFVLDTADLEVGREPLMVECTFVWDKAEYYHNTTVSAGCRE